MGQQITKPIKLLLADDHQLFMNGLSGLLKELSKNLIILGEATDGKQLCQMYERLHPDLVISDISMPTYSGLEAAEEILKYDPDAKILFITMHDTDDYIYYAHSVGAKGIIAKDSHKDELLFAIKSIAIDNSVYFRNKSESEVNLIIKRYGNSSVPERSVSLIDCTEREREVIMLWAENLTNEEVAERLNISVKTLSFHKSNIKKKYNINTNPDFYAFLASVKVRKTKKSLGKAG